MERKQPGHFHLLWLVPLAGMQFWDSRNFIKQDVFIGGGEPIPGYATLIIDSSMGVS